jgi:hypothetical protein
MRKREMSDIEYRESGQAHQDMYDALMRLRAALTQIATVCNDNAQAPDQGKGMALDFVHQIAGAALASDNGPKR